MDTMLHLAQELPLAGKTTLWGDNLGCQHRSILDTVSHLSLSKGNKILCAFVDPRADFDEYACRITKDFEAYWSKKRWSFYPRRFDRSLYLLIWRVSAITFPNRFRCWPNWKSALELSFTLSRSFSASDSSAPGRHLHRCWSLWGYACDLIMGRHLSW